MVLPNPELPFVVEEDASTTGVGAVLSQWQGTPEKLHPCTFFSRKLSQTELNYDIGNRELLAVKLTFTTHLPLLVSSLSRRKTEDYGHVWITVP